MTKLRINCIFINVSFKGLVVVFSHSLLGRLVVWFCGQAEGGSGFPSLVRERTRVDCDESSF